MEGESPSQRASGCCCCLVRLAVGGGTALEKKAQDNDRIFFIMLSSQGQPERISSLTVSSVPTFKISAAAGASTYSCFARQRNSPFCLMKTALNKIVCRSLYSLVGEKGLGQRRMRGSPSLDLIDTSPIHRPVQQLQNFGSMAH